MPLFPLLRVSNLSAKKTESAQFLACRDYMVRSYNRLIEVLVSRVWSSSSYGKWLEMVLL